MTTVTSKEQQQVHPKPLTDKTVKLVQITDTHLYADTARKMRGVNTSDSLNGVLDAIAAHENPDLLLATGDLRQDGSHEAYQRFAESVARLDVPVLALAGNHDDPTAMAEALADTGIALDKFRDVGDWRILQIHTPVAGEVWGRLDDAELDWLEAHLAENRYTLLCMHHPPLSVCSQWLERISLTNASALFNVLDRHCGTVKGVIAGHVHQEMHARRGTVHYYTTPSTSVQFEPGAKKKTFDTVAPGYRRLFLHPDGRIESNVVRVEGANAT